MKLSHDVVVAPGARPVHTAVFLHGILGTGANLRTLARRLVAARPHWRALLVDLRNHGGSLGAEGPDTVAQAALDVADTARALGLTLEGAIGHSFGGKVALGLLAHQPLMTHVALLDSAPGPRPQGRGSEVTLDVVELLASLHGPWNSREAFVSLVTSAGQPLTVARWLAMQLTADHDGVFRFGPDLPRTRALLASYFAWDAWPLLEAERGPLMHVIVADRSPVFEEVERTRLAALVASNARVTSQSLDAGHWVHVDAFEPLTASLAHFFRSRLLDGDRVRTLDDFYAEVTRSLGLDPSWERSRDALDALLTKGMATPPMGFTWVWRGVPSLKKALGEAGFRAFVELVRRHGPGGEQAEDGVELVLAER